MTSRFPKRNSPGSVLTELSQLRDELRIKLHLAGLEVRAQWESVEPKLLGLERSLEQQGEGALDAAGELAVELVKAFRDFSVRGHEGGPSQAPVHDIMRVRVHTCGLDDTLHRAAQIMWEKDCGCLPVIDSTHRVHAVITDRDICMACWSRGCAPGALVVAEVMAKVLYSCGPDDALVAAEAIMRSRQIRRLPVLDGSGHLLGILSIADLARQAAREQERRLGSPESKAALATLANICQPHQPVEYA